MPVGHVSGVMMPLLSGIELATQLREFGPACLLGRER
jgi:hypothetical protein